MNEEKLEEILNKIGRENVPPNAALIAERVSQNFSTVLKIPQPRQSFFGPLRLIAAAAVIVLVFAAGRWSKSLPQGHPSPAITAYAQMNSQNNTDSFWRQRAIAAMQSRLTVQTNISYTEKFNAYKKYLKEKYND